MILVIFVHFFNHMHKEEVCPFLDQRQKREKAAKVPLWVFLWERFSRAPLVFFGFSDLELNA